MGQRVGHMGKHLYFNYGIRKANVAQTPDGTPYVEGSDFVSGYPAVSQALAEQIDALRRMQPVGMITPYAGELNTADDLAAVDGWLPCDGKAYKRGDFPELYTRMSIWQVHTGFPPDTPNGSPNTANFYVPDFRGRSPIGATAIGDTDTGPSGNPVYPWQLGERWGDKRVGDHIHTINYKNDTYQALSSGTGSENRTIHISGVSNSANSGISNLMEAATGFATVSHNSGAMSTRLDRLPLGSAINFQPSTGVNFLIWTGTTTTGKSPISGVEVAAITTRQMIEARMQDAGISDEQMAMLREQLTALRDEEN